MEKNDARTLWCGNLSAEVTEDLLYELFLQAGPMEKVCIPKNPKGLGNRNYGFVTFKHAVSARYAIDLMQGVTLFDRLLHIRCRTQSQNSISGMEPSSSSMGFQQSSSPRMVPMRTGNMGMLSPVVSSRQSAELIVLDSDSSPSSVSSTQKNRSRDCNESRSFNDIQGFRSFSDGPAAIKSPHINPGFWIQPYSPLNVTMLNALQDPWKQFDSRTVVEAQGDALDHNRQHRHQHQSHHQRSHHNNWSPYGNQHRRF